MVLNEVLTIVGAVLFSLGGVSLIVFSLSSWLGKVWANRILEADRAEHSQRLEEMRHELALKNQSLLEAERAKYSSDLEKLRATLVRANEELGAENQARRDYEYDARKRLYTECEPLLFRLSEASENALHRIYSLARTARMGDLGPKQPSWLDSPSYYMSSTIYNLLVPLVIFRLLQDKLTLVDLTVDSCISTQYLIAKSLYISFTEPFVLANKPPILEYKPFIENWEVERIAMPETHWSQGLTLGSLDVAIEGMINRRSDDIDRCMTFGEFEASFRDDLQGDGPTFGHFVDILRSFHPARRPVLWRILVVQAHLYAKLMEVSVHRGVTVFITDIPIDFSGDDMASLNWRQPGEDQCEDAILEPVQVAKDYLHTRLTTIF